jgi:hypothetical protein
MTTTPTTAMTLLHTTAMLAAHLAHHAVPEPASLTVTTRNDHSEITTQLRSHTVPAVAADLLAWADTLSVVTAKAWRPPAGDRVHLSLTSTLTSPASTAKLRVFGGADDGHTRFADLQAGDHQTVSLGQLHTWAANLPETTALEAHGAQR